MRKNCERIKKIVIGLTDWKMYHIITKQWGKIEYRSTDILRISEILIQEGALP